MDFDDVLTLIGGYGWSQKKIIYVLGSSHAFISFNILILSFIGTEEPEWSCSGASKADQATGTDVMNRHRIADANACLAYERGECIPVYSDGESSSIVAEVNNLLLNSIMIISGIHRIKIEKFLLGHG